MTGELYCQSRGIFPECAADDSQEMFNFAGCIACERCVLSERENLQDQALRDPLTGLGNRRLLLERFNDYTAERKPRLGALAFDISNFKEVNERLGHAAGDALLQAAGQLLENSVRGADAVVGRTGGDEFGVLANLRPRERSQMSNMQRLEIMSTRIVVDFFTSPEATEYNKLVPPGSYIGLKPGMAVYKPGMTLEELFNKADPKGEQLGTAFDARARIPNPRAQFLSSVEQYATIHGAFERPS